MDKAIIRNYIKDNLTLDVNEESYGFNGTHIVIKLVLENETISEEYIDVSRDEG